MWFVHVDQYVFFVVIGLFIVLHIALLTWLYMVPFKHRKDMKRKDAHYQLLMSHKKIRQNIQANGKNAEKSPPFSGIPIET
jgi:hypothetical protein